MSTTPWAALTVAIRKLADKVDAMPVVREATLVSDDAVRFDIDTHDVLLHGNLAKGMPPGTRVLTLTLRHYVWVLGGRDTVVSGLSLSRVAEVRTVKASTWTSPMSDFAWEETVSSPDLLVSPSGGVVCQRAGVYRAEFYTYLQFGETLLEGMVGIMSGTGSPSVDTFERVSALGNWAGGHSFGQVSIEGPMEVGQRWVPWMYVDSATQTRGHKTVLSVRRIGDA